MSTCIMWEQRYCGLKPDECFTNFLVSLHWTLSYDLPPNTLSTSFPWSRININTLRPRQNGRRIADDTFKRIFFNETIMISIKISLKFVSKGPMDNIPALVQIMATSHYLNQWRLVYWRIYASLGRYDLMTLCATDTKSHPTDLNKPELHFSRTWSISKSRS